MFALEVSINGEVALTAGVEDWTLIHADILALRANEKIEEDRFEIKVDGMPQQVTQGQHEHIRWGTKRLQLGDVIQVRLIETESVDPPIKRYRSDKEVQENPFTEEEIYEMEKETYLQLKKKFEKKDV
jgi:hypothetical protein